MTNTGGLDKGTIVRHAFPFVRFVLACGLLAATQLAAQSPTDRANMKRLVGNWHHENPLGPGLYKAHNLVTMEGNSLVFYSVPDEDNALLNILKGDKAWMYRFKLDGRRIIGKWNAVAAVSLSGVVSEDFRELQFRRVLNNAGGSPREIVDVQIYHKE
jgi:hypothetical protein